MFIIKNALRSIARAKGRNILIGIIALVIAISACIALSIKEAAVKARNDTLETMNITANIEVDRKAMMSSAVGSDGKPDRDAMKNMLQSMQSLSLEDYQKYAKASSVKSFYYTISSSLDAGDAIEPVDTAGTFSSGKDTDSQTESGKNPFDNMPQPGNGGGFMGKMGSQGDFTVVGYSSDAAMTGFIDGSQSITDGAIFEEGTTDNNCIISDELATYNEIAVGQEITLLNPNDETETVTLKVVGIYTNAKTSDSTGNMMGGFNTSMDSANAIYMSYNALNKIVETSKAGAEETTDENTGLTSSTAIAGTLSGTYVLDGMEEYETFKDQVRDMGLDETYTVSSTDVTQFEQSLTPLENLSNMSDYFLLVVFAIGAIILVVINIFNIRERKYEIGVLTAIGMKKIKVAGQFIAELFIITLCAMLIGAGVGAAASVPVTNMLLSAQISSNVSKAQSVQQNFGRGPGENVVGGATDKGSMTGALQAPTDMPNESGGKNFMGNLMGSAVDYVSEVSYSTNLMVILKLILVGIGLTLISSFAAVLFIMRYEPLKILTSRE